MGNCCGIAKIEPATAETAGEPKELEEPRQEVPTRPLPISAICVLQTCLMPILVPAVCLGKALKDKFQDYVESLGVKVSLSEFKS